MNFVVKIKKNFLILLTAMLLVGCNNNDIKYIDINKTIITNEKVNVKFLGKRDNISSFEIENKLNNEISGDLNLKLNVKNCKSIEENLKNSEFQKLRNLDNMETVKFAKYEQDGNIENGKEDIEWLIVTKNAKEALLLSKDILDCKPFNIKEINGKFESSYLFNWLNNYFYQEAFRDIDKNKTIIKNNISLLKYDDIVKYFGIENDEKENEILGSCGTNYARNYVENKEFYIEELDNMTTLATALHLSDDCWYRNNSPYYIIDQDMSCGVVECDGSIHLDDDERGNQFNIGIRPAIWIKLEHRSCLH